MKVRKQRMRDLMVENREELNLYYKHVINVGFIIYQQTL